MGAFLLNILNNRYVIGGILIFVVLSGAVIYYKWSEHKIESLTKKVNELTVVVETQQKIIAEQKVNYEKIIASNKELVETTETLNRKNKELEDTLYREREGKKSLEELARKKTRLIEKLVNRGTKEVLDCFETISKGGSC